MRKKKKIYIVIKNLKKELENLRQQKVVLIF